MLLVAAIVGLLLVACGGAEVGERAAQGKPTPRATPVPGFADRFEPAVVAVGDDLFVFGGKRPTAPGTYEDEPIHPLDDGALIDVSSGEATALPESPFDVPLINPAAIKVGDVVVVVGDQCIGSRPPEDNATFCEPGTYAAAGFNLKTKKWREIAIPAELRSVKEGRAEVVGSTGDGRAVYALGMMTPEYWAYSPGEDRWTRLKVGGSENAQACLARDQLVELSLSIPINGPAAIAELTQFDVTRGEASPRTPVPGGPRHPFAMGALVCLDDQVLVQDPQGEPNGAQRYDRATGTWSTITNAPTSLFGFKPVWTGVELVFLPTPGLIGKPALAYDPRTSGWRSIANPPPITTHAVWNGTKIVGYAEPLRGLTADAFEAGVFTFPVARTE